MSWINTVSDFHQTIAHDAADLANQHPDKHPQFNFTATPTNSDKTERGVDGISMEWDREGGLRNFDPVERQEITARMEQIARDAVRQSLIDNQDLFVGVILGEARQGRNYFDNFRNPNQGELF